MFSPTLEHRDEEVRKTMDEFFILALLAGTGVAVAAAPFGCFLMWRRMAFAADALAHASLLGVALALSWEFAPFWGIALALSALATLIFLMRNQLSLDAVSHVGAHAALSCGVLILAWTRRPVEWERYLFGDVLALTRGEALFTAAACLLLALGAWCLRRPLLSAALTPESARMDHPRLPLAEFLFFLMTAAFVAAAVRSVGLLLINGMMITAAAAARPLSRGPAGMMLWAMAVGVAGVIMGLWSSLQWDLPAAPAIVASESVLFAASWLGAKFRGGRR